MRVRLLPDKRWSQLVDTTAAILEDVAPYDVVVDDIATRAEVSRSLVYRYFSGLDDLLGHARRRFFHTLWTDLEQVLDVEREPLDHLRAVVATTVHFAAEHPGTFCNLVDGGVPSHSNDSPVTAAILRLTPTLRPRCDTALAAKATAALIEAGIVAWLRDDRSDTNAVIDLLSDLAACGLQKRAGTPAQRPRPPLDNTVDLDVVIPMFGSDHTLVPGRHPDTVSHGLGVGR